MRERNEDKMRKIMLGALAGIGFAAAAAEAPVSRFDSDTEQMKYYHVEFPLSAYPPEMVAAGRTRPDFHEIAGFETLDGWTLKSNPEGMTLKKSAATRVHGKYAAELSLNRRENTTFELIPPAPLPVDGQENAALLWNRTLQFSYSGGPVYELGLKIRDARGRDHAVAFTNSPIGFRMWMPYLVRLPEPSAAMPRPWKIVAVTGRIRPRRKIAPPYFVLLDSLQLFEDRLDFPAAVPPLPLPEPTAEDTIRPVPVTPVKNRIERRGRNVSFVAESDRETIRYTVSPETGTFDDLTVEFNGRKFRPLAGGGPVFEAEEELLRPGDEFLKTVLKGTEWRDGVYRTRFQARSSVGGDGYTDELIDYEIAWSLHGKTLYIDFSSPQGRTAEITFGAVDGDAGELMIVPYLRIDPNGPKIWIGKDYYLSALADPWRSDATKLFGNAAGVNGGVRYEKLTDGTRNPPNERFMLSVSGEFSEILPKLPNPVSPYIEKYAAASWRWGMSEWNWPLEFYWQGVRDFQFRSHADLHRDINESYGYRAAAAPSKGEAFIQNLSRGLRERGFGYAPYNSYMDQNPFGPEFSVRDLRRDSNGQFRSYQVTPAAAQRLQERYAPEFVRLYQPTFSYLDVHGCREPWRNPDMRAGAWMAGKFRGEFLGHAALIRRNRELFNGPCFTEGGCNWLYAGFYDATYGYCGHGLSFMELDDIVDFDLLRIKPHAIQLGMGDWNMYYRGKADPSDDSRVRQFAAATLAYGHAAMPEADKARVYFLTNAVQRRYLGVPVSSIGYSDGKKLMPSSAALHTAARKKGFIHVAYENGLKLYVNLNKQGDPWTIAGRTIPAPGYYAVMPDGKMEAFSLDYDLVKSPEYHYIHTRNAPVNVPGIRVASGGAAFRPDGAGRFLLFPQKTFRDLAFHPAQLGLPAAASYQVKLIDLDGRTIAERSIAADQGGWIRLEKPEPKVACYEFTEEK